jgi:HEAT repeat protein
MNRRRTLVISVTVAITLITLLTVAFWPGEKEPEYQGKKLSEWIESGAPAPSADDDKHAIEAIRHIGTNALPLLLTWVEEDSFEDTRLWRLTRGLPLFVRDSAPVRWLVSRFWDHNYIGLRGFKLMGSQAGQAVGELATAMNQASRPTADRLVFVLSYIGEPAFPVLKSLVIRPWSSHMRQWALTYGFAGELGTNTSQAALLVAQQLNDADPAVVQGAAYGMGNFPDRADLAVPALVNCMSSRFAGVRLAAVSSIANFGTNASAAVPALMQEISDPEEIIRPWASNSLLRIAPEVLTNATRSKHD